MNPNPITSPIESDVCRQCHQSAKPGERALLNPEGQWIHDPQHNPCAAYILPSDARQAQYGSDGLAEVILDLQQRLARLEGTTRHPYEELSRQDRVRIAGGLYRECGNQSERAALAAELYCACSDDRADHILKTPNVQIALQRAARLTPTDRMDTAALLIALAIGDGVAGRVLRDLGIESINIVEACEGITGQHYDLGAI